MRSTWRRPSVLLAAAATAALALGGCSDKTGGNATGGSTTQPGTTAAQQSTSAAATSSAAPVNRPKTLDLQGVDPCSLITDQLTQSLQMDRPKTPSKALPKLDKSPMCGTRSTTTTLSLAITLDTTQGLRAWQNTNQATDLPATTAAGFPAAKLVNTDPAAPSCFLYVDTADNQFLVAGVLYSGDGAAPSSDQLCAAAQQVTESVLAAASAH